MDIKRLRELAGITEDVAEPVAAPAEQLWDLVNQVTGRPWKKGLTQDDARAEWDALSPAQKKEIKMVKA